MPLHEIYANGVVVERIEVPATIDDVKAEAQRRIIAVCGASDLMGAIVKQLNATNPELGQQIDAIRAAARLIKADPPIDVSIDPRWPS